jgi:hypothetical protein
MFLFADSRTACTWQSFVNNQSQMQSAFKAAMLKLSTLGQNRANMVDCSDVIPVPRPLPAGAGPHLPAGARMTDIEQACASAPFPSLTAQPGETLSPFHILTAYSLHSRTCHFNSSGVGFRVY